MDLDFYTRKEDQSKYINDVLEIDDELSILITQIENLLFTRKTQILGQKDFGINLEDLLFTLKKNESEIKTAVLNQIYAYCPLAVKYRVDVAVIFQKTAVRDVAYIDIFVKDSRIIGILI